MFYEVRKNMRKRVIALDMDGTITQHRTMLEDKNRKVLENLKKKYGVVVVGAGDWERIDRQLDVREIDIIGNYGMQIALFNKKNKEFDILKNEVIPVNKENIRKRVKMIREKYGLNDYKGDSVEFHKSGVITLPILGTKAEVQDKLLFDPDRKKRKKMYKEIRLAFSEYSVFIGGSSSFDMAPYPYDKLCALETYMKIKGVRYEDVIYIGDDYGEGGNDNSVYKSEIDFVKIDNYLDFEDIIRAYVLSDE